MSFPKKPVQWQLFSPVTWKTCHWLLPLCRIMQVHFLTNNMSVHHSTSTTNSGIEWKFISFQIPHVPSCSTVHGQFQQLFRDFPARFAWKITPFFPPPAWHSRLVVVAQCQLVSEFHLGWPVQKCGCLVGWCGSWRKRRLKNKLCMCMYTLTYI